ncbi:unnamed protein product [Ambrosiozyma monospora]|uniref:Unnamed protein product n=1 Tax=Ambrosiozyma monospora TaxID=43982 RepID=A0ACB5U7X1_AMBMO|nr:unnamed protein product [Ambrosiozyma monospora]
MYYTKYQMMQYGDNIVWEDSMAHFNNEVEAYKRIWNHNDNAPIAQRIHVPKFWFSSETTRDKWKRVWFNEKELRPMFGPYMVLEHLGSSLRPPETTEEFLKVEQVLLKLAALGIRHKDLREANFLFDENSGLAYIIDFELVQLTPDGYRFRSDVINKELRETFLMSC